MRNRNYIIIGVLAFVAALVIGVLIILDGLSGMGNPNGSRAPDYPYFITTEPLTIRNLNLPKGTKLTYEESFFKEGQQDRIMSEKNLTTIELPKGKPIIWGGVPVYMFLKFFNPEMKGYTVSADFEKLPKNQRTKFSQIWQNCGGELAVLVNNTEDWSFNTKNIVDVSSCSVIYQRFFKEDEEQQRFLDTLLKELKDNGKNQTK
ncbi:hypothetical protein ASG22_00935 [Chryseobacterium sp. Leaf405]|uniref:hypothetical protein n=1 Tax=Chryseobacterium sp. Leaf405 TaxID=1736367 RepID=UPI0006F8B552|nr:hypothetical protein [Chryseobacterium sp. Leaf405]KQT35621.1 hypothetical protein ASG22_00935 [Chryseobacterium sp. Leaf405]